MSRMCFCSLVLVRHLPADYVTRVLVNGPKPAHGTAEMPVWGPLFSELNAKGRVTVEIDRVVHYLESLQEK